MELFHFTTKNTRRNIQRGDPLVPGYGAEVCYSRTPKVVYDNWWDFFRNQKANWLCSSRSIPCLADVELWRTSKELGRLLSYIRNRSGPLNFRGFALASFMTKPSDLVWVCEGDFLKRFHEGELNSYDSHLAFAESRVELRDYKDQFKLPEYRIGNSLDSERILWLPISNKIKPITLKTTREEEKVMETLHF